MRSLKYVEALREAAFLAMEADPKVFVMGIGADDHKELFGSVAGLRKKFGPERVFDTPLSEAAMTGVAIGAALNGMRPIHVHIRVDFLYLALDQLLNLAAKWRYMFGGKMSVPITVRAVIGRSWGQGAQHSQSLQSFFMHVPGVKMVMPTTPAEAKGYLLSAIADPNPVVIIEHRLLYDQKGEVPEGDLRMPFPNTVLRRPGKDLTIVSNSYSTIECLKAAEALAQRGIEAEVLDPVVLSPLDAGPIVKSVQKTGRLLIVDTGWVACGMSAEVAARVAELAPQALKRPVRRLGMAPSACPVSKPLENVFYPGPSAIASAALDLLGANASGLDGSPLETAFKGPF